MFWRNNDVRLVYCISPWNLSVIFSRQRWYIVQSYQVRCDGLFWWSLYHIVSIDVEIDIWHKNVFKYPRMHMPAQRRECSYMGMSSLRKKNSNTLVTTWICKMLTHWGRMTTCKAIIGSDNGLSLVQRTNAKGWVIGHWRKWKWIFTSMKLNKIGVGYSQQHHQETGDSSVCSMNSHDDVIK